MKKIMADEYKKLFGEIRTRIRSAQYDALKAVNKELICLYWDIGMMIVDKQKKHGWGKSIVESLARDLQAEFPGMQGYSTQNLWYMRQFYIEYSENKKLQPLVGEISWTKNIVIMSKCKNSFEREFYIRASLKTGCVILSVSEGSPRLLRGFFAALRMTPMQKRVFRGAHKKDSDRTKRYHQIIG